jgi:hypothetical protein
MEIDLKQTNEQLDARLASLRATIKNKRNNIQDLENILEQDRQRLRSFPIYCWILLIIHLTFMLNGWKEGKALGFVLNFVMYHWYIKKYFGDIYMKIAVPLSVMVMIVWSLN